MPTRSPRVNVTVTEEQHALLLELAKLQGGSASGYVREMLDAATPLLRLTVPMLRAATEQMELSNEEAARLLQEPMRLLKDMGLLDQMDLLDRAPATTSAPPGAPAASVSERGRAWWRGKGR